jgi:pimeloyl-ACP methyl ester carboxylesterase
MAPDIVETTGGLRVGERTLRWVEVGAGLRSVVLEAGIGGDSTGWASVLPELAAGAHAVAYDRAGLGRSDPCESLPTLDSQVEDLAAVARHTGQGRSVVLAGHSWGGMLVQLLAFRQPELVAGLVLVDPYHEELVTNLPGWARRLVRLADDHIRQPLQELTGRVTEGQLAEWRGVAATINPPALRQMRASTSFPEVPVVVLSAARGFPRALRTRWTRLQAGVARAAVRGKHLVVAGAGHDIPRDEPNAVAEAILAVVADTAVTRV